MSQSTDMQNCAVEATSARSAGCCSHASPAQHSFDFSPMECAPLRYWTRREWMQAAFTLLLFSQQSAACDKAGRFAFPGDYGAHPRTLTEWWYITGWLRDSAGAALGMQITFFRTRPQVQEDNPSAFAPKQLLFAHAALSDPVVARLQHDQRASRAGFALAQASELTTDVRIDDWSLERAQDGYRARIRARDFEFDLAFAPTQPVLLQGPGGFSRKGPHRDESSCYYSFPHLAVSGTVSSAASQRAVSGRAWLDHEWSDHYLAKAASGWDWMGINFDDGSALMAFRIRAKRGGEYWASATLRTAQGEVRTFSPLSVAFEPLRRWRSPHSGT